MPNIDDNTPINVQLYNETEEEKIKQADGENMTEDATSKDEVRSLLEYLYLDVKVRSPSEVRPFVRQSI